MASAIGWSTVHAIVCPLDKRTFRRDGLHEGLWPITRVRNYVTTHLRD